MMAAKAKFLVDQSEISRADPPKQRLDWLNKVLEVGETANPITGVVVDGYEETSAIVLLREGAARSCFPARPRCSTRNACSRSSAP